MKNAGVNHIILQIDQIYNQKAPSEKIDLFQDTTYHPEQHVRGIGKCLAVPASKLVGKENGIIVPEVEVGDEVLFHYIIINDGNYIDKQTYRCEYQHVFAVRRDGDWKMIGGWIMMQPTYEDGVEKVEIEGRDVAVRQTQSGIITETNIKPSAEFAELIKIGTPTTDREDSPYVPGDKVMYIKDMDFEVEVDGKRIYMMRQEELLGKVS